MRQKPLSARRQMKAVVRLRDEVSETLGLGASKVENLTKQLAPLARRGGGTESDVLVLLHRIAHHHLQRPHDFDYILGSTFRSVDDLTLEGVHGLPLKALIRDPAPLIEVGTTICDLLWPGPWSAHRASVEARNLQIDHARMSATAALTTELEQLKEVRDRMEQLGVEPDPSLEAQAGKERDAAGIPAPPWDK